MKTLTATGAHSQRRPITLGPLAYWHLLSLDAPTVAAVWTIFIARAAHVALPLFSPAAMFLAVWAIYAADRLMDARKQQNLEARHRFHGRYRAAFLTALVAAVLLLLPLIALMPARSRYAYVAMGGLLLVWLALVHLVKTRPPLPKELAVGFFFSAAVFIPTVSRSSHAGLVLPALFFANLCSLNCLFIYAWEHPPERRGTPHATTAFGLRLLRSIAAMSILLPLAMLPFTSSIGQPILLAVSVGASFLLVLHRMRSRIDRVGLRTAADLALLSPLILLHWVR